jgi:hypothetical protein
MLMGGRPARVIVTVGTRDGAVSSQSSEVEIETYWHKIPEFNPDRWFEYTLIAATHRVLQFDFADRLGAEAKQLTLHPNYLIGRPGGCEICILGYVYITPYGDPADLHRLTQFNLSCLPRIRPCVDEADIMPAAWKQYLAEHTQARN